LYDGREKILCDYKPQTSHIRVRAKADRALPRQCRQLTSISETDIRHVLSEDNPVVDALSRVDSVIMPVIVDTEELAQQQITDKELHRKSSFGIILI